MADGRVRSVLVVVSEPDLHLFRASASVRNQWAFRHSLRKLPLNASMKALSGMMSLVPLFL